MKKILIIVLSVLLPGVVLAQNFNKYLATAKSSYSSGKLEDSRFAMEQMMQELDITIGKEVLKLLPVKLDNLNVNPASDNVTGMTGFLGVNIHRDYGSADKKAVVDMITNSPLVASINTILSIPLVGNSADGNQKRVKIDGYRGLLQKNVNSENQKVNYELQMPFNSTLLTFRMENAEEAEVLKMAAQIPIAQIAKMLQ
ncbi:MAG TPA: hypothetical protein VLZ28_03535 [Daejeonella sp.]|nr:hypothetical protein [Daejeonella sp.]